MNTYADKTRENKSRSVAHEVPQKQSNGGSIFQFLDNRPDAIAQRNLQDIANKSPQVRQLKALQEMANNSPQAKHAAQLEAMVDNYSIQQWQLIQKKASSEHGRMENNTGLPDNLKSGIENLSGYSMDGVREHYNSNKPAQFQAHAYAQGTDIHLGSGQKKHLPHEAWHVVQQKQGRVKPTVQMKGNVNINDDAGLEKEADIMGAKAFQYTESRPATFLQRKLQGLANNNPPAKPSQLQIHTYERRLGSPAVSTASHNGTIQRYTTHEKPSGLLSEDKNMIVTDNTKSLFATSERIADSNTKLAATGPFGSMIKLTKEGGAKTSKMAPNKEFIKAVPKLNFSAYHARISANINSVHKPMKGQTKQKLELWADCRKASEVVTGSNTTMGAHDRQVNIGGELQGGYSGSINRPNQISNDSTTGRLAMQVYASQIGPLLTKYGPKALNGKKLKQLFPTLNNIQEKSKILQWLEVMKNEAPTDISIAERLYASLVPEGKQAFHRDTKTNEYANPEIGDAYSTVTEYGMPDFEESGDDWAFHWGGVVMKGGSDNVTLENLSVSQSNIRNTNWFFAMYGTRQKNQTFHARQTGSGHHGNIATTISVETIGSNENRKLLELKNEIDGLRQIERSIGVDQRVDILKVAVKYNELAAMLSRELLTEYVIFGSSDRSFTAEDKKHIHTLKKKFIPK